MGNTQAPRYIHAHRQIHIATHPDTQRHQTQSEACTQKPTHTENSDTFSDTHMQAHLPPNIPTQIHTDT